MVAGASAWAVVRVRPEAALLPPELAAEISSAAAHIDSHRGAGARQEGRFVVFDTAGGYFSFVAHAAPEAGSGGAPPAGEQSGL